MIILAFLLEISTLMVSVDTLAQPDSLRRVNENIEHLYQLFVERAEDQTESADEANEDDYEELLLAYHYYQENPININSDDIVHLEEMGLLGIFQVEALRKYRRQFGDLLFLDELLMLEEFNEATAAVIDPLIYFGKSEKTQEGEQGSARKILTQCKHQVTLNYAEKFDETNDDDYLGSPRKIQVKYAYRYKQRFRIGFAMEKDAGEPFLFKGLSDSIRGLVSQYRHQGFDFYGAYCFATDLTIGGVRRGSARQGWVIKDLALGDYQLSFGQGLTLWTGMSLGKASEGLISCFAK